MRIGRQRVSEFNAYMVHSDLTRVHYFAPHHDETPPWCDTNGHIILKHVPDYQDLLEVPIGANSEALEHLHKVIRQALRHQVVTTSLVAVN